MTNTRLTWLTYIPTIIAAQINPGTHYDLRWYAPNQTSINELDRVIHDTGVYGYIFDSSSTPSNVPYQTYNWCNMPHVRQQEYVKTPVEYTLEYVELIHRHHKRTPYASNTFSLETYPWHCDNESLFYYGTPQPDNVGAAVNWQVYTSPANPFTPAGFQGTCQFPQITGDGLLDSRKHGLDLFAVYHDLLHFLPSSMDKDRVVFRVTNNQITSQVASQIIQGMYRIRNHVATSVLVQSLSVDSLEPGYSCPAGSALYASYGVGSNNTKWEQHLDLSRKLFRTLDAVSGIEANNTDWHQWFDHYFDNLSARLCHDKPLPCNAKDPQMCLTRADADAVFRRGLYEYSFIYRDSPQSLQASVATYGVWLAELSANLKNVIAGHDKVIWRHNIAHDGSISRLLSFLQVDVMVWPGMGAEVIFELYSNDRTEWFVRVLWGGQILQSSSPMLGRLDLLPVKTLLAYIDGLVGDGASRIPELCKKV